ncbi:MAG: S-methyl-5-thioribose-1-phosphate isomerase [Chloroflexi bacterium]|nr:S-methyl-5-thioribose-1-phosphate isomerase [Chloroflexota bacterium]
MTFTTALTFRPIYWAGDNKIRLIDQTRLPAEEVWLELGDYRDAIAAIRDMRIRGAPAIGVAGAYAVALAAIEFAGQGSFLAKLEKAAREIEQARPTGANLAWAVRRMLQVARRVESAGSAVEALVSEAKRIQDEDEAANLRMGRFGADLIARGTAVLTHCNTGALATGGYGTALGVIRAAWADGRLSRVFATETRPFLQGARLTAWELLKAGIDATLIPDSAAGHLMRKGQIQAAIVGADRIAANGDVANKIGTYTLAVLAKENGVPFYVAAPTSTIDMSLPSGDAIPIEERRADEVTHIGDVRIAPEGISALNVAFDVTPHQYVTAIITEKGVVREPYLESLRRLGV